MLFKLIGFIFLWLFTLKDYEIEKQKEQRKEFKKILNYDYDDFLENNKPWWKLDI